MVGDFTSDSLEMTWWLNHPKWWYLTIQNGNLKPAFSGGFNGSKLGILPWFYDEEWCYYGISAREYWESRDPFWGNARGFGASWWSVSLEGEVLGGIGCDNLRASPWILLVKTPLKTTYSLFAVDVPFNPLSGKCRELCSRSYGGNKSQLHDIPKGYPFQGPTVSIHVYRAIGD